jgi:hypothetical protein
MKMFSFVYTDNGREIEVYEDGTYKVADSSTNGGFWKIEDGVLHFKRNTDTKWTPFNKECSNYESVFCAQMLKGIIEVVENELLEIKE